MKNELTLDALFFIAIVFRNDHGERITAVKKRLSHEFDSSKALNSPPHITIVPPFKMELKKLKVELSPILTGLTSGVHSFKLLTSGFGAFVPRVIFIQPEKHAGLISLHALIHDKLSEHFHEIKAPSRPFHPHITVAFKDLKSEQFWQAWKIYKDMPYHDILPVQDVSILKHNGQVWEEFLLFPLCEEA